MKGKFRMLERTDPRTEAKTYQIQRHIWLYGWVPVYHGLHTDEASAWARWRKVTQPGPTDERVVAVAEVKA